MCGFCGGVIEAENPCYIMLANRWIILNSGGGPAHAEGHNKLCPYRRPGCGR
jgi:hypothetical protein